MSQTGLMDYWIHGLFGWCAKATIQQSTNPLIHQSTYSQLPPTGTT